MELHPKSRETRRKLVQRTVLRFFSTSLISIVAHAILVILLIRIMVTPPASDASRQITATLEENQVEPDLEEIKPLEELVDDLLAPTPELAPAVPEEEVVPQVATVNEEVRSIESPLTVPMLMNNDVTAQQLQRGQGTTFGFSAQVKGDLVGTMYDLKRDRKGGPRAAEYVVDLQRALAGGLDKNAFKDFYRVPRPLYLSHLFVPRAAAETGPQAFGVGDLMESRNWIVHYAGEIQAAVADRYRFVGVFDDLLMVLVDGKVVHEFLWTGDPTPWQPADFVRAHACFAGQPLVYGEWFELTSMQRRRIDILVGEHPGGQVGGLLLIQREGEDYARAADGRPILPIFTLQPLTPTEEQQLYGFTGWELDRRIPILGARYDLRKQARGSAATDVSIVIE
jgi:hypothetical protein